MPSMVSVIAGGIGFGSTMADAVTRGYGFGIQKTIFSTIMSQITTLITGQMTQANGFSKDYGSVNNYDITAATYPAVYYEYPNEDDIESPELNRYSVDSLVTFRVVNPTGTDLEVVSDRTTADFNLLFGQFRETLKAVGLIDFEYLGTVCNKQAIKDYPVVTRVQYRLKYRRIMSTPYVVDNVATPETFVGSVWADSTPIWNRITAQIKTAIEAMSPLTGYTYDYGTVDEFAPESQTFPAVVLGYPEEQGLAEIDNQIGYITSQRLLEIRIWGNGDTDLDNVAFLYRADMGRMFDAYLPELQAAGMHDYQYQGSLYRYKAVNNNPVEIVLRFVIFFNRQRKDPYQT